MDRDIFIRNGGIYCGHVVQQTEGKPIYSGPPLQAAIDGHVVLLGPSGAGKGRGFLLPQLASLLGWSIVVLDIKGELCRATARHRADNGSEVIILDPFSVTGLESHRFNPLASIDVEDDEFPDRIRTLAQATIEVSEHGDPYWPISARGLWSFLTAYACLTGDGSYGYARELLGQKPVNLAKTADAAAKLAMDRDVRELKIWAAPFTTSKGESKEILSVINSTLAATEWISSRPIRRNMSEEGLTRDGKPDTGRIEWARMKSTPVTTYIVIPGGKVFSHPAWLKVVFSDILQALLASTEASVPTLLLIDEANIIAGLEILERSLTVLRGYGVKIMSVYQDYPTAKLALKDRTESYIANSGLWISFRANDYTTATELSKRTGQVTGQSVNYSTSSDVDSNKPGNLSFGQQKLPGMLPQQFMNMDRGYACAWGEGIKGTLRLYLPDASDIPKIRHLAAKMG